jgi:hypothetical protein
LSIVVHDVRKGMVRLTALYTSLEVCTSDRNTPTTVEVLTKGPEAGWKSRWRGIVVRQPNDP